MFPREKRALEIVQDAAEALPRHHQPEDLACNERSEKTAHDRDPGQQRPRREPARKKKQRHEHEIEQAGDGSLVASARSIVPLQAALEIGPAAFFESRQRKPYRARSPRHAPTAQPIEVVQIRRHEDRLGQRPDPRPRGERVRCHVQLVFPGAAAFHGDRRAGSPIPRRARVTRLALSQFNPGARPSVTSRLRGPTPARRGLPAARRRRSPAASARGSRCRRCRP